MLASLLASCEESNENGKLDGMWQLTEVAYSRGGQYDSIANTKDARVYISFQRRLGAITPGTYRSDTIGNQVMMRFHYSGSSLSLYNFYVYRETWGEIGTERHVTETLLTDSASILLRPFGIDGIRADFHIDNLSRTRMTLTSDYAHLTLKKF